jgi:hypothetical protein
MARLHLTLRLGAICVTVAGVAGAQPAEEPTDEPPAKATSEAPPSTDAADEANDVAGDAPGGQAKAAPPGASAESRDRISYRVNVDAVAQLFRRSTFPTAGGALVEGDVAAPLYHFAMFRVDDIDAPWAEDSIDAELSAWGNLVFADDGSPFGDAGRLEGVGRLDGDIQIAKVRQRFDFGHVALGRQVRAGGAARFVRYDGATAGLRAPFGLGVDAYGGFTVLPRWAARPGYHLLGSAADTLLRHDLETVYPNPDRNEHWMVGGRAYYAYENLVSAGLSFHEQRAQGGLFRRNAAVDTKVRPLDELSVTGQVVLDVDATNVADARAAVDVFPMKGLNLAAVYLHVTPALMLSRQSVLSVFSTDKFNEWGLEGGYRPLRWLSLGASGYIERFETGDVGGRGGGSLRFFHEGNTRVVTGLSYRRVVETENGYHSLRAMVKVEPPIPVELMVDGYGYFYDEVIQGASGSEVVVVSAGVRPTDVVKLVLGGSIASTPFAALDAQALARVAVDWEGDIR